MKNKNLKTFITIVIVLLIVALVWFFMKNNKEINNSVGNNNDTVLNETNNNENVDNNGETDNDGYINNNGDGEITYKNDEGLSIQIPEEGQVVTSPFDIVGRAEGPWYFEANIGARLIDADSGTIIADSYVTALDDWMTEESVEFSGEMYYEVEEETDALLILESGNPSGLEENQMIYSMPITLEPSNQ
jgi:hypothetical protein